eukprot:scaffold50839_cov65-Phaeocystis_antarctica.AAC.1
MQESCINCNINWPHAGAQHLSQLAADLVSSLLTVPVETRLGTSGAAAVLQHAAPLRAAAGRQRGAGRQLDGQRRLDAPRRHLRAARGAQCGARPSGRGCRGGGPEGGQRGGQGGGQGGRGGGGERGRRRWEHAHAVARRLGLGLRLLRCARAHDVARRLGLAQCVGRGGRQAGERRQGAHVGGRAQLRLARRDEQLGRRRLPQQLVHERRRRDGLAGRRGGRSLVQPERDRPELAGLRLRRAADVAAAAAAAGLGAAAQLRLHEPLQPGADQRGHRGAARLHLQQRAVQGVQVVPLAPRPRLELRRRLPRALRLHADAAAARAVHVGAPLQGESRAHLAVLARRGAAAAAPRAGALRAGAVARDLVPQRVPRALGHLQLRALVEGPQHILRGARARRQPRQQCGAAAAGLLLLRARARGERPRAHGGPVAHAAAARREARRHVRAHLLREGQGARRQAHRPPREHPAHPAARPEDDNLLDLRRQLVRMACVARAGARFPRGVAPACREILPTPTDRMCGK